MELLRERGTIEALMADYTRTPWIFLTARVEEKQWKAKGARKTKFAGFQRSGAHSERRENVGMFDIPTFSQHC